MTENITLSDIAGAVYLPVFHFRQAFLLLTVLSSAEYLRKHRLSQTVAILMK